ncbi:MAG: fused signal recognition particle receptor [Rickettsiales bacterium]|jgi:fused signal recognition particle receptor
MSLKRIFSPSKINRQLTKTSGLFSGKVSQIFTHRKLDNEVLEELEDLLITSDIGAITAAKIIKDLKSQKFNKEIGDDEIKQFLSDELFKILLPCQKSLQIDPALKPQVIVFNGVNGAGKTTTIGKIAKNLSDDGKKVMIAACDTFRAGASEQLKVWANRANCQIVEALKENEDPASVAHRAFVEAKKQGVDALLIDTAGRLQNKQNLMNELKKINQVLKKIDALAPHQNLLVLDATNGQNAKNQLDIFNQIVGIDGIIVTKLDGTAKGGILVALAEEFAKPIYAIGVGEKIEDLQEFNARDFASNMISFKELAK